MKIICFIAMIYMHIIDDYYLQGILSKLKRYKYWINLEGFDKKYGNDYKVALIVHGLSWSISVMIPILIYRWNQITDFWALLFGAILLANALIHSYIDNLKANEMLINLWQDQLFHLIQIICIFILFMINII